MQNEDQSGAELGDHTHTCLRRDRPIGEAMVCLSRPTAADDGGGQRLVID
jgi:hypothetical protein